MHPPARNPNDLEKFFVERANNRDVTGLVALYEPGAVVAYGDGQYAVGLERIQEFFESFVAGRPELEPGAQAPAVCSGDVALTSTTLTNGDVTAEIARRQQDGTWLWVVDHFALVKRT